MAPKSIPEYPPGTIVFAKLRGYPWWPARVSGMICLRCTYFITIGSSSAKVNLEEGSLLCETDKDSEAMTGLNTTIGQEVVTYNIPMTDFGLMVGGR
jgi:hypothetical protein